MGSARHDVHRTEAACRTALRNPVVMENVGASIVYA